ncbi:putative toxin-antitoxin system, toxin component [Roseibium sp. TrichSKD4]|nr:putative toxin-antitoxin system, toxin component [Roseibium sp. TrichSKD4]
MRHHPTALFDADGNRDFIRAIEDEAEWLGPALLVSEEAALFAYRQIQLGTETVQTLSDKWTISVDVINMRMNVVGAKRRFRRAA